MSPERTLGQELWVSAVTCHHTISQRQEEENPVGAYETGTLSAVSSRGICGCGEKGEPYQGSSQGSEVTSVLNQKRFSRMSPIIRHISWPESQTTHPELWVCLLSNSGVFWKDKDAAYLKIRIQATSLSVLLASNSPNRIIKYEVLSSFKKGGSGYNWTKALELSLVLPSMATIAWGTQAKPCLLICPRYLPMSNSSHCPSSYTVPVYTLTTTPILSLCMFCNIPQPHWTELHHLSIEIFSQKPSPPPPQITEHKHIWTSSQKQHGVTEEF